jgi:hypothetical protein
MKVNRDASKTVILLSKLKKKKRKWLSFPIKWTII